MPAKKALKGNSSDSSSIIVGFVSPFTEILADSILVIVYMFLLLYYRSRFPKFIMKVVSKDNREQARAIIIESSKVAQQYLIGRSILIVILAVLYSIGLTIVGLQNAIILSLIAALLSIIPYVGNVIALAMLLLMGLTQGRGSMIYLSIIIVYSITQFIESYILEPYVVGSEVDIHPFFTVVIIIIGQFIWGVAGMILAIPLLGMVKIVFSHIDVLEPFAYLIGDTRNESNSKISTSIEHWLGLS